METKEEEEQMEGNNCRSMKLIVLRQRAEPSTPTASWTLHFSGNPHFLHSTVSARKLCANLWEFLPQITSPKPIPKKKKREGFELQRHLPRQPENASSSRRHATDSLVQQHKSIVRDTPSELLSAFDRICSLEEKQSCFVSSLKSLKAELNHSHSQINKLLKEKQSDRTRIVPEYKASKKKEQKQDQDQDQVKGLIRSAQAEVEGERRLAQELSHVKSAFSNALKELERERKARILLEKLCDEFAKGIRDYEQEVRSLRHKPDMDHVSRGNPDRLILHISEAWLDERMQMGLAESQQNDDTGKNTIVDNLSLDIETFLQARHSNGSKKSRSFLNEAINNQSPRESFPLSSHHKLSGSCSGDRKLDNQSVSSQGDKNHPEDNINVDPVNSKQANPTQKLKSKLTSPEIESTLQLPSGAKENTLKAKLLEARLDGRKYRTLMTTPGNGSHT